MKPYLPLLAVLSGCPKAEPGVVQLQPDEPRLQSLQWLAGSWVSLEEGRRVEEHWTQPAAGSMHGMTRTTVKGRTVFYEYLRIELADDGVVFLASPRGRAPATPFWLTAMEGQRVVFENPEHDDPKRVIYERRGTQLIATTQGEDTNRWVYVRAALPAD